MTRLSVIIITHNEAANIQGCLRSVSFADEVVVLDSGSTDGTAAIATQMGAKFHVTADWPGSGRKRTARLSWPRIPGFCPWMPTSGCRRSWVLRSAK